MSGLGEYRFELLVRAGSADEAERIVRQLVGDTVLAQMRMLVRVEPEHADGGVLGEARRLVEEGEPFLIEDLCDADD